jgi:hypothetical protein
MKIFCKKFSSNRNYGIELEIGNEVSPHFISSVIRNSSNVPVKNNLYRSSINNNYWDVKMDGSCGKTTDEFGMNEGGYEITTFKASGHKQLQHICKVIQDIKKIGVKVNKNCGLHVHVDISDFTEEDVGRLIQHWLFVERIILMAVPDRRRCNKYCMPFSYNERYSLRENATAIEVWNHYKPSHILSHNNIDRRKTMNLVNYCRYLRVKKFKRSTVEFRFPEGTLSANIVKNWVRLLIEFVNNVKNNDIYLEYLNKKNFRDQLYVLGLGNSKNCFNIFSKSLRETKAWFLKRILRYGYDSNVSSILLTNTMIWGDEDVKEEVFKILSEMGATHETHKK